jgi:hypothetical protein
VAPDGLCFFRSLGLVLKMDVSGVKSLIIKLAKALPEAEWSQIRSDLQPSLLNADREAYFKALRSVSYYGGTADLGIFGSESFT